MSKSTKFLPSFHKAIVEELPPLFRRAAEALANEGKINIIGVSSEDPTLSSPRQIAHKTLITIQNPLIRIIWVNWLETGKAILNDKIVPIKKPKSAIRNIVPQKGERFECIYFIKDGSRVKIGHSANLERRLMLYKIHNPEMEILGLFINRKRSEEKGIRKRFSKYHLKGEWFKYNSVSIEHFDMFLSSMSSEERMLLDHYNGQIKIWKIRGKGNKELNQKSFGYFQETECRKIPRLKGTNSPDPRVQQLIAVLHNRRTN